jgi:hypothetical protein
LLGSSSPGSLAGSVSQLRQQFRKATDYGLFSGAARVLAENGNSEAQYLLSRALDWCGQRIQSYFRTPDGGLRDLQDVQKKWEVLPAGPTDQILATIFSRCHSFMGNPSLLNEGGTAGDWQERAAQAGYSAAQAQKAADQNASILMNNARSDIKSGVFSESEAPARRIALTAAMSGDPDAIFLMSNWVRASDDRSPDQTSALVVAWQMVACQQNYDCAPDADWMQNICSLDRQCSAGQTYDDFFLREFGAEYDAAVSFAASISQALATQDIEALQSFL